MRVESLVSAVEQYRKRLLPIKPALDVPRMKARQRSKIEEIRMALIAAGLSTLDQQARALALSRSTAWSILRASHKTSGLSAGIINRILASPRLPALARRKVHEYVLARIAGLYGHTERRRREFAASLSTAQLKNLIVEASGRNNDRQQPRPPKQRRTSQQAQHRRRKTAPRRNRPAPC